MPNNAGYILRNDGGKILLNVGGAITRASNIRLVNFQFPHSVGLSVTGGIRVLLVTLLLWGWA